VPDEERQPPQAPSAWTPHPWVLVAPVGLVVVSYALWFGFVWLFRFPDWLSSGTTFRG